MTYLTSEELIHRFEYYTAFLEEKLAQEDEFREIVNCLPFAVIVGSPRELDIAYTNKTHEEWTGYAEEQVRRNSLNYLKDIVYHKSLDNIRRFLPAFYASHNDHRTLAFLQYARLGNNPEYAPLFTFTKAPATDNSKVVRLIAQPRAMGSMSARMERVIDMDSFKLKHFKQFQQLTRREVEVLKLLAGGYDNARIGQQLHISRQTVETHRKRIKQKLELVSFRDLMRYALSFGLLSFQEN